MQWNLELLEFKCIFKYSEYHDVPIVYFLEKMGAHIFLRDACCEFQACRGSSCGNWASCHTNLCSFEHQKGSDSPSNLANRWAYIRMLYSVNFIITTMWSFRVDWNKIKGWNVLLFNFIGGFLGVHFWQNFQTQ